MDSGGTSSRTTSGAACWWGSRDLLCICTHGYKHSQMLLNTGGKVTALCPLFLATAFQDWQESDLPPINVSGDFPGFCMPRSGRCVTFCLLPLPNCLHRDGRTSMSLEICQVPKGAPLHCRQPCPQDSVVHHAPRKKVITVGKVEAKKRSSMPRCRASICLRGQQQHKKISALADTGKWC